MNKPTEMKTETKSRIEVKEIKEDGTGLARFATMGVLDHDGDVTERGAFGEQYVKMVAAHNYLTIPLGKARIFESGDEALAEFKFNLDIEQGREWHNALKFDMADGRPLQEWSYGYSIVEGGRETRDGETVRVLKKLKVHEISPVVIGAGIGTATLQVKRGPIPFATQIGETLESVRDVMARAKEIAELRAEDGRGLSEERLAQLGELKAALAGAGALVTSLDGVLKQKGEDFDPSEAERLLAAFTAFQVGFRLDAQN